jgi:Tfp pilus assembly protein PilN
MNRWAIIAVAFAVVAAWGFWQRSGWVSAKAEADRLSTELSTTKAALAQVEEAARVHRAHLARRERLDQAAADTRNDLATMEGGDAPLSPYLRAASDRLWGQGGE